MDSIMVQVFKVISVQVRASYQQKEVHALRYCGYQLPSVYWYGNQSPRAISHSRNGLRSQRSQLM